MSYINNNLLDNILIFLTLILIIGYLSKKKYETVIFFIVISVILFFLFKNISFALIISILLINLFISLNYFNDKEGNENQKPNRNEDNKYVTLNQLDEKIATNNEFILKEVKDMI